MAKRGRKKRRAAIAFPHVPFERVLFYGIAFLVFTLPVFLWPSVSEYGYGKTVVALVGISLLAILWGLSAWQQGSWRIRLPWVTIPILGLVVASLLSLVAATNGRVVVQSLVVVLYFALLFLIVANAVRDRRDVDLLLAVLLISASLAALYGLLQYLGIMRGPTGRPGLESLISTMGNRNYVGGFLSYLLLPAVVLVVRPRPRWLRWLSILLIAFCFTIVLLVKQSGTVVSLLLSGAVLLVGCVIFRPVEPIRRGRVWLMILLGVLAVAFLVGSPSSPLNSVVGLSSEGQSVLAAWWERNAGRVRGWDWWVGWEMFLDRPWTGVGLGHYKLDFLEYKARFLATPRGEAYDFFIARAAQAHNEYVQVLAELGILGALALLSFVAVLAASLWKRLRANDETNRLDLLLFTCGIGVFLAHAFVSFPAHLPSSALVLVLLGGLIFSRTYGESAVIPIRLSGWRLKVSVAAVAVVGTVVSVVAVRDMKADVLMNEGIRHAHLGQFHTAESLFERSLELDFAPHQTYYHLAVVQIERGDFEQARTNLERCLTRFVDEAVYLNYANLLASLRQFDRAREAIDFLLSTHPQRQIAMRARYVQALLVAQTEDPREGIQLLEELVADEPAFETAYIGLGSLYEARGMTTNARKAYERALTIIERTLARAEAKLADTTTVTIEKYGQLRSEIEQLRQSRTTVLGRLAALPDPASP